MLIRIIIFICGIIFIYFVCRLTTRFLHTFDAKDYCLALIYIILAVVCFIYALTNHSYATDAKPTCIPTYNEVEWIFTKEEFYKVVKPEELIEERNVELLANTLYGEARGLSDLEKSAVVWCILNRVDKGYADNIYDVVSAKNQFVGYVEGRTYYPEIKAYEKCKEIAYDVLLRWYKEKFGIENVGRTLPKDYLYFVCKDGVNVFTKEWKGTNYWDWSLVNPYK